MIGVSVAVLAPRARGGGLQAGFRDGGVKRVRERGRVWCGCLFRSRQAVTEPGRWCHAFALRWKWLSLGPVGARHQGDGTGERTSRQRIVDDVEPVPGR